MSESEFKVILREFGFVNICADGLHSRPNMLSARGHVETGLAIVKEGGMLPFPYEYDDVYCLKVISDPSPLFVLDAEAIQDHRKKWAGKILPIYTDSIMGDIDCASFQEAVHFLEDFLCSVKNIFDRSVYILDKLHEQIRDSISNFQSFKGSYNIIPELCKLREERRSPEFEEFRVTSSMHGTLIDVVCSLGIAVERLEGLDDGKIIVSTFGIMDESDSRLFRYRDPWFISEWKDRYVIVKNDTLCPLEVDTENDVFNFIRGFLLSVNSSILTNEMSRSANGLHYIIDYMENCDKFMKKGI